MNRLVLFFFTLREQTGKQLLKMLNFCRNDDIRILKKNVILKCRQLNYFISLTTRLLTYGDKRSLSHIKL